MPKCRRSDSGCGPFKRPKVAVPADEAHAVRGALFSAHSAVARQLEDADSADPAPFTYVKANLPGCLRAMHEVGCDLSAVEDSCEGESLAICAAMHGRAECLKVHYAAACGFERKLRFLSSAGCDLRQADREGRTAADLAAQFGRHDALRFLCRCDAAK